MLAPYRIAAPPEPEAPDPVDEYEALLRARALRARLVVTATVAVIGALSAVALLESPPPKAVKHEAAEKLLAARLAQTRERITAVRARAAEEQARFAAAIIAASETAELPAEGPCPVRLPEANRLVQGSQAFPLLVVARGDHDVPSPSIAALLADVQRAEEHLDRGRLMDGILYANALESKTRLKQDVVVVATSMKRPVRTNVRTYEPGEIEGRAYVYDFTERRVVCAGDVRASSSRRIEYSYLPAHLDGPIALAQGPRLSAELDFDLDVQLQRAIARSALAAVAP